MCRQMVLGSSKENAGAGSPRTETPMVPLSATQRASGRGLHVAQIVVERATFNVSRLTANRQQTKPLLTPEFRNRIAEIIVRELLETTAVPVVVEFTED